MSIFRIFLLILAMTWCVGSESVMNAPAKTYMLGTGVSLTFGTHAECQARWPAIFKKEEPPGWILKGEFIPQGYHSSTRTFIFIVVEDPSIYTEDYLKRLVRALYYLNLHGFKLNEADLLADVTDNQFEEAGVLQHEMSHNSDSQPEWFGRQCQMLHDLFPRVVPKPPDQPLANPWQIVRLFWPAEATHPGFDMRDYSVGFYGKWRPIP